MGQSQTSVEQTRRQASGQTSQAKDKVQDLAGQAGEQVQQVAGQAQEQVKGQLDQRSTQLGEQISTTADDLRAVAEELRRKDKGQPATLAEQAADKADRFADYLKKSDGQTILSDLEDLGRRQPWAIVVGGATLGFLASRFIKSSSANRNRSGTSTHRGLEYDGPVRSPDLATATHVPPVDDAGPNGTPSAGGIAPEDVGAASGASTAFENSVAGGTGDEGPIGAGPGGTRISAPPVMPAPTTPAGGGSPSEAGAPGAITGATASGAVDTPTAPPREDDRPESGSPSGRSS